MFIKNAVDAILKNPGRSMTPYEMDLEVKDRKPRIVPKVGDKVKIKSLEWYNKWKDVLGSVDVPQTFTDYMARFCGETFKVTANYGSGYFYLEDTDNFIFSMEMFEDVFPASSSTQTGLTISSQNKIDADGCLYVKKDTMSWWTHVVAGGLAAAALKGKEPELETLKRYRFLKFEKL